MSNWLSNEQLAKVDTVFNRTTAVTFKLLDTLFFYSLLFKWVKPPRFAKRLAARLAMKVPRFIVTYSLLQLKRLQDFNCRTS